MNLFTNMNMNRILIFTVIKKYAMKLTVGAYNELIDEANKRIETIKTLPYYRIFGTEQERMKDIMQKLNLIIWLINRKFKYHGNCN